MVKHVVQMNKNECGIACIKMFYSLLGIDVSYYDICDKIKIEKRGISLDEMIKKMNEIGHFKAYEIEKSKLKDMCPSIIILNKKRNSHYVMLYKYEDGYFYLSDPALTKITKVKESKVLNDFTGYIIFNQKRKVELSIKPKFKVSLGSFRIPYVILSLLEVFLMTYSMLYLFSIKDFTIIKIKNFIFIIFINCVISIIKNLCFNKMQKYIENNCIDNIIYNDFIDGKINKVNDLKSKIYLGYLLKNNYFKFFVVILSNLLIILGTCVYCFLISKYIFISILICFILTFIINLTFSILKNKLLNKNINNELRLDKYKDKVLTKDSKNEILDIFKKIKIASSLSVSYEQCNQVVNYIIKQFGLMIILIITYLIKLNVYSIFVITFYVYSFDGVVIFSEYLANINDRRVIRDTFLYE